MTAIAARLPLPIRRWLRPWLPQAFPLWEGADWTITRRDLWEFLALLIFFSLTFVVWRAFA